MPSKSKISRDSRPHGSQGTWMHDRVLNSRSLPVNSEEVVLLLLRACVMLADVLDSEDDRSPIIFPSCARLRRLTMRVEGAVEAEDFGNCGTKPTLVNTLTRDAKSNPGKLVTHRQLQLCRLRRRLRNFRYQWRDGRN